MEYEDHNTEAEQADTRPISVEESVNQALDQLTAEKSGRNDDKASHEDHSDNEKTRPDRVRDGSGRFAAKDEQPDSAAEKAAPVKETAAPESTEQPDTQPEAEKAAATGHRPPASWSIAAKTAFDNLPPEVRESVAKREEEVNNGLRILQDYKGLEQYTPVLKSQGISHSDAIGKALGWDDALRKNPVFGIAELAKAYNVDIRKLAGMMPPDDGRTQQPVDIRTEVERVLTQREQQQLQAQAADEAQRFLNNPANIWAHDVRPTMAALLQSGQCETYQEAYEAACYAHPQIRPLFINQQAGQTAPPSNGAAKSDAVQSARAAAKATTGNGPSTGRMPSATPPLRPGASVEETVEYAMRVHGAA
jgi:hypothetical protein